jgi:PTH1 family peptidyl-tRNA hydrolase
MRPKSDDASGRRMRCISPFSADGLWEGFCVIFLVGLGNPGEKYKLNRHNAGFMVLDRLAEQHHISISQTIFDAHIGKGKVAGQTVLLAQPQTFMNHSGITVRKLTDYYQIELDNIIVVHDDLDLPFQTLRLKAGGGHGGHKGLISIIDHLGAADFLRVSRWSKAMSCRLFLMRR